MKFETLMMMDRTNTVATFASIGMIDPYEKPAKDALAKAKKTVDEYLWNNDVYPKDTMKAAHKLLQPPKCIFIPSKKMMRSMVKAVVRKKPDESEFDFLLKFGLVENIGRYMKKS